MSITKSIVTGVTIALIGTAAMAEGPKIYPYASKDNYCPNGLQPITISGVICCGTPTTDQSYQSTEGPKIYPYASKDNYCPNGLQPITISGVICCGTPTTDQSYQSTMAHPTSKKHYKKKYVHKARSADTCAEGTKGCY